MEEFITEGNLDVNSNAQTQSQAPLFAKPFHTDNT